MAVRLVRGGESRGAPARYRHAGGQRGAWRSLCGAGACERLGHPGPWGV